MKLCCSLKGTGNLWDWTKMSLRQVKVGREVQRSRIGTILKTQNHREIYLKTSKASSCVQVQRPENEETTEKTGSG